ncbi:MAG: NusA-like transcription termination signal-binding factor [Nitrososphaerota archaeon]|nr:NusA-like transcription termination signal-binding factor [Nitrososphaerota archaeon]MDG7049248.1 NusA-like transcription termination signal-binding factor [Nitrososphaerota archaeon]MDG7051050.1 NusA-like transcription termination signal-binding factor [Nitrososphaerota archaeon]
MSEIKYTNEELGFMRLFQSLTGIEPRDCIVDKTFDRVILVVNKGMMGITIGKDGQRINYVRKATGKTVIVVEYADTLEELIKNTVGPKYVIGVRETHSVDGSKSCIVTVNQKDKGAIFGTGGQNIEKLKLLSNRYFGINQVKVMSI